MIKPPFKINLHNLELSKIIQEKLFSLGYEWICSGKEIQGYGENRFAHVKSNKKIVTNELEGVPEITVYDLFTENEVEVKLSVGYTAIICNQGVKVGCQIFSFDKIDELKKAVDEFRNF